MCNLTWIKKIKTCQLIKIKKDRDNQYQLARAEVQQAGEELRDAYQVLSRVEDADMVDYAVFTLQAAEKRYSYLVKKLKEQESRQEKTATGNNGPVPLRCIER